jgi:hypothetical protein
MAGLNISVNIICDDGNSISTEIFVSGCVRPCKEATQDAITANRLGAFIRVGYDVEVFAKEIIVWERGISLRVFVLKQTDMKVVQKYFGTLRVAYGRRSSVNKQADCI